MEIKNRYLVIKHQIDDSPQESDFEVKLETLSEPGPDNVIVKTLYVSVDPYLLNRMKSYSSSQKAHPAASRINPGENMFISVKITGTDFLKVGHGWITDLELSVMLRNPTGRHGVVTDITVYGVGKIVASGHPNFEKDDLVRGAINWAEYTHTNGAALTKLDPMGLSFPLSYHAGILAFARLTAYGGFFKLLKPKKGESIFVSAASGSVGNIVGQFAKLMGCYVVGSAGSKHKVEILKDDAFNYKDETDFKSTLKRHFPNGIDMYFDNVGGEMLEAAVDNMNPLGRIAVCGVISEYTDAKKRAAPNMLDIIYKRITIQGFLSIDFFPDFEEFMTTTTKYIKSGEMKVLEDISCGFESIPSAFIELFQGKNVGKKLVKVSED